jgi:hypothetical protein
VALGTRESSDPSDRVMSERPPSMDWNPVWFGLSPGLFSSPWTVCLWPCVNALASVSHSFDEPAFATCQSKNPPVGRTGYAQASGFLHTPTPRVRGSLAGGAHACLADNQLLTTWSSLIDLRGWRALEFEVVRALSARPQASRPTEADEREFV